MISGEYCEEKRRLLMDYIVNTFMLMEARLDKLEASQRTLLERNR